MLTLKDIKKDYKVAQSFVHALRGVSLSFRQNEFVCILGPSGCGKTTLLNIIGGLDHYTSGDLVIQGKSTKDFKDRDWDVYRNHRIGFIFQSYNLIPHQTVLGNVELALTIAGVGREERRERAKKALERVGLGNELDKKPNQLSGGQMQRVAIARALVNNPDILLADEPTGALDSKTSVEVMELIKEIAGERLVIMVTHNPELAEQYASRIVRLHDGVVESDSDPYSEEEEGKEVRETPSAVTIQEEAPKDNRDADQKTAGKGKKPRARMSFLTSLALSARNLLTKKGRTIVTSVAGSIGIISVCLVLALSSGFNSYIRRTEEDMLSYYPVEITQSTLDLSAVMNNAGSLDTLPDMDNLEDKVYVNSFLTQLAQGIAVTNNISGDYLNYLEDGKSAHPDWFSEIKYSYGVSLTDNLFTSVETGGVLDREKNEYTPTATEIMSLSKLRKFYTDELIKLAPEYQSLLAYVDFFTDVLGVMPGTDLSAEGYSNYILSQYDVLDPETMHFPQNENEAVLVVGGKNDATDLTLAQLGFLPESEFMELFDMGKLEEDDGTEAAEGKTYKAKEFSDILSKDYTLYFNKAVYTQKKTTSVTEQPFLYSGTRSDLSSVKDGEDIGIPLKITAVLRLKEGRTYGCLSEGLNITESTLQHYIRVNKESDIVKWATSSDAKLPAAFTELLKTALNIDGMDELEGYRSPSAQLNDSYSAIDLSAIRNTIASSLGEGFMQGISRRMSLLNIPSPLDGETVLRADVIEFLQNRRESLVGTPIVPNMPNAVITDAVVDEMIEEVENLPATVAGTVEHQALATALGSPLVAVAVEPALGMQLAGTIFVSYMPDTVVRLLGGNDEPNGVYIYPADFDSKENVLSYLDAWNGMDGRAEEDKITYTDRVGLLMGMMQTMLDVITYVLVAFTSISLVVSSVMIGIITYVSVVERVKEIGVLRSLGARKMDIRNLFNAETFIIGLAAGLIGIVVTYLLSIVINLIIFTLSGIGGIAALPPLTAAIMVCVSVVLTLVSGLIPAQAAAKKDPVIALRTE